jgi:hypothetical protein
MTEVPARVLDFWQAFDRIEPIGDQWLQSAMLAQMASQGHSLQMAAVGQSHSPKSYEDFMPERWKPDKKAPEPRKGLGLNAMRAKQEMRIKNA